MALDTERDWELCGGCEQMVRPNKVEKGLCDKCRKTVKKKLSKKGK